MLLLLLPSLHPSPAIHPSVVKMYGAVADPLSKIGVAVVLATPPAPPPAPVQPPSGYENSYPSHPDPPPLPRPPSIIPRAPSSASPSGFLACIRQKESGGNYQAVNPSGAGGAYQFMPSTWRSMGYSGRPQDASQAMQDAAAQRLYASSGRGPWVTASLC